MGRGSWKGSFNKRKIRQWRQEREGKSYGPTKMRAQGIGNIKLLWRKSTALPVVYGKESLKETEESRGSL